MSIESAPVRVLVIDDSVVVRRVVTQALNSAEDVEVIGTASDGELGLARIAQLHPDVVTLDIEMPGMGGLETLAVIRREMPTLPVIMYSSITEAGATATLEALALGAVDYATKPSGAGDRAEASRHITDDLLPLVRAWGRREVAAPRVSSRPKAAPDGVDAAPGPRVPASPRVRRSPGPDLHPCELIVIGVSTGGPDALAELLPSLPRHLSVPVVIVQHMPPVFTTQLARRLDRVSVLEVVEVTEPRIATAGTIYLAPGGRHLEVHRRAGQLGLELGDGPLENSCRPAVDVLFRTASAATDGHLVAAVLTGMGQDGLEGARVIKAAGGSVLTQDEATSVVWGMPGFVTRAGLATEVLPLDQLADALVARSLTTGDGATRGILV